MRGSAVRASAAQVVRGNIAVLKSLTLRICSVRRATPATRIIRLALNGASFPYQAGQAAMVGLSGRRELVPYSIASAPEESTAHGYLEFLVKLDGSGGPDDLASLRRGAEVRVQGPMGTFVFPRRPEEQQFLFVAGGTGIAPLRAMVVHAFLSRHPGRLHLLYSARTPSDFAYRPELKRYERQGRLDLSLTATREFSPGWRGERGRITSRRLADLLETEETLCFVCGPAAMVNDVPRMLLELGVEKKRIRIEEW